MTLLKIIGTVIIYMVCSFVGNVIWEPVKAIRRFMKELKNNYTN